MHVPGNHGNPETNKCAYTQASDGTNDNFDNARESETYTRVYCVHAAHRPPEVDGKDEVGGVDEDR